MTDMGNRLFWFVSGYKIPRSLLSTTQLLQHCVSWWFSSLIKSPKKMIRNQKRMKWHMVSFVHWKRLQEVDIWSTRYPVKLRWHYHFTSMCQRCLLSLPRFMSIDQQRITWILTTDAVIKDLRFGANWKCVDQSLHAFSNSKLSKMMGIRSRVLMSLFQAQGAQFIVTRTCLPIDHQELFRKARVSTNDATHSCCIYSHQAIQWNLGK